MNSVEIIKTAITLSSTAIIVLSTILFNSFKGNGFKYDTVTDLRKQRKYFDDKHYKVKTKTSSKGGI